ncbi:hypothetical protein CDAR_225121 [Caerostris darwini]|uniref:Uncharacterized protein n=1 Tax=Caerostris darwini TaxID=1538125 RepID=A0AAV4T379_9ARAC|nr:hypothetical protein CDAR_225121 [Caerostris darwini]
MQMQSYQFVVLTVVQRFKAVSSSFFYPGSLQTFHFPSEVPNLVSISFFFSHPPSQFADFVGASHVFFTKLKRYFVPLLNLVCREAYPVTLMYRRYLFTVAYKNLPAFISPLFPCH